MLFFSFMSWDVETHCYTPVFWDSESVHSGPGNLCHRCISKASPFFFFFKEITLWWTALVCSSKNTHSCECLASHCGEHWLDISLAWRLCPVAHHIKGHAHPTGCCQFVHWQLHQSLCCFKPTQYDPELSFPITHSLPITPIKLPAYWPTRAKTHQKKGKWVRESNQILHLYLCSTRCIQNGNSLN